MKIFHGEPNTKKVTTYYMENGKMIVQIYYKQVNCK